MPLYTSRENKRTTEATPFHTAESYSRESAWELSDGFILQKTEHRRRSTRVLMDPFLRGHPCAGITVPSGRLRGGHKTHPRRIPPALTGEKSLFIRFRTARVLTARNGTLLSRQSITSFRRLLHGEMPFRNDINKDKKSAQNQTGRRGSPEPTTAHVKQYGISCSKKTAKA